MPSRGGEKRISEGWVVFQTRFAQNPVSDVEK